MALDKQQSPTEAAITLVDIEELRKILGAEADILLGFGNDPIVVRAYSTVMCPKHPWER